MPYKRVCTYEDLDILFKDYTKMVINKFKELNENAVLPSNQEYKKFWEKALGNLPSVERCLAKYASGKHKGERCQASPQENSKYCAKHKHIDPEQRHKDAREFYEKNPEKLDEIEFIRKTNLNE